jgi:uncharacterized Zn-binding protein involved in type VI secretion
MPPAARLTDLHACPMIEPGQPPTPHVGGPVLGPGVATVLIGRMPAAALGDNPLAWDVIVQGSQTVLIGGRLPPAWRHHGPRGLHRDGLCNGDHRGLMSQNPAASETDQQAQDVTA